MNDRNASKGSPKKNGKFTNFTSRLKGANPNQKRTDSYGTPIKGGSGHKISFSSELVKVHKVENWKVYNADEETKSNTCKCRIY